MKRATVCVGVGFVVAIVMLAPGWPAYAEPAKSMETGKAFTKLMRGAINLSTGWVEIPKRIHETAQTSGAWAGVTWGLLRGIGHGFIRTAAGGYEILTFPVPAPPDYEPVIQPEYVFSEESRTRGR